MDGYDSFITFTDYYSRYGYIYPIKERTEALDKFKIFKAEVEKPTQFKDQDSQVRPWEGSTMVVIPHMAKFLDLLQGSYRRMA